MANNSTTGATGPPTIPKQPCYFQNASIYIAYYH